MNSRVEESELTMVRRTNQLKNKFEEDQKKQTSLILEILKETLGTTERRIIQKTRIYIDASIADQKPTIIY